eukprot:scaffold64684_cov36-Phaeocystis_antarctica.AAC.1
MKPPPASPSKPPPSKPLKPPPSKPLKPALQGEGRASRREDVPPGLRPSPPWSIGYWRSAWR